jgi:hypothetical protein
MPLSLGCPVKGRARGDRLGPSSTLASRSYSASASPAPLTSATWLAVGTAVDAVASSGAAPKRATARLQTVPDGLRRSAGAG